MYGVRNESSRVIIVDELRSDVLFTMLESDKFWRDNILASSSLQPE